MKKLTKTLIVSGVALVISSGAILVNTMDNQDSTPKKAVSELKVDNKVASVKSEPVEKVEAPQSSKQDIQIEPPKNQKEPVVTPTYLTVDEVRAAILPSIVETEDFYILQTLKYGYNSIERAVLNTYVANPTPFTKEATPTIVKLCLKQLNTTIQESKEKGIPYDYRNGICTV